MSLSNFTPIPTDSKNCPYVFQKIYILSGDYSAYQPGPGIYPTRFSYGFALVADAGCLTLIVIGVAAAMAGIG